MGTKLASWLVKPYNYEGLHKLVLIRREMGRDINGACGQLRRRHLENSD